MSLLEDTDRVKIWHILQCTLANTWRRPLRLFQALISILSVQSNVIRIYQN